MAVPVDTRGPSIGVCLICEATVTAAAEEELEDAFFTHFEQEHASVEPIYTTLESN